MAVLKRLDFAGTSNRLIWVLAHFDIIRIYDVPLTFQ